ncbi:MAG: C25 family cysteine peptidase, partial [Chloroflexi bacterium]|nr:C25 family cysteine peptidase [Chloroflexota bacterium]
HPAVAIGRIPAKTPAQLSAVVEKIIAYEQLGRVQDWQTRAVFVADDKDATFAESVKMLSAQLPATMQPQKILLADHQGNVNETRPLVVQNWNAGAGLMTYIGHGSIDTWAAGPLFGADNLAEIKNGTRLPILFTPTCLDGFFYHPQKDSLAENLLFKTDGGIIAGLVPTGLSLPYAQDVMMRALFTELFERGTPTLGEAITRAKAQVPATSAEMREVIDTFVLLGDPALANPFAQSSAR